MAMGKRASEQAPMGIPTTDLAVSRGHPFYARLNAVLAEAGFDRFAEEQCRPFYAPVMGAAQPAAGAVLPVAAARLLRGARLGTRHRLARGGFAGGAQLRGIRPRDRGTGSFHDLAHPAVDRRRGPSGGLPPRPPARSNDRGTAPGTSPPSAGPPCADGSARTLYEAIHRR